MQKPIKQTIANTQGKRNSNSNSTNDNNSTNETNMKYI